MPRLISSVHNPGSSPAMFTLGKTSATDFVPLRKQINIPEDLRTFFASETYAELRLWILQLTRSCLPLPEHRLDQPIEHSRAVTSVRQLLFDLACLIDSAPPDTGPRRFGNVAFRKWVALLKDNVDDLVKKHLATPADIELKSYLLESFGSPQRLDYGTGHELSFLAFLGGLWKLNFFSEGEEWSIVAGCIDPYLKLVRRLIKTYTLEPAGSHGVWGLDDHCFIPYILGSAQLARPTAPGSPVPQEGSLDTAPDPATITSLATVNEYKSQNFYYAAVAFILEVKTGPFFEHSPYLYNISGIKDGWGKINKGMLKMYDAEVLGKFPVVQHFGFGNLWEWKGENEGMQFVAVPQAQQAAHQATQAPWARSDTQATQAPWAHSATQATQASRTHPMQQAMAAPWSQTPSGPRVPGSAIEANRLPYPRQGRKP